jgi:hypothetical protein
MYKVMPGGPTERGYKALAYAIRCTDANEACLSGNRAMSHALADDLERAGWLSPVRPGFWRVTPAGREAHAKASELVDGVLLPVEA